VKTRVMSPGVLSCAEVAKITPPPQLASMRTNWTLYLMGVSKAVTFNCTTYWPVPQSARFGEAAVNAKLTSSFVVCGGTSRVKEPAVPVMGSS
jgi:hypothetical protein